MINKKKKIIPRKKIIAEQSRVVFAPGVEDSKSCRIVSRVTTAYIIHPNPAAQCSCIQPWSAVCPRRPKSRSASIRRLNDSYDETSGMPGES